jgi:hypothetical protein
VLPIKLPYVSSADNNYGRVTMLIQEFSAQAVIAHENSRYNFIFETEIKDRYIELNPKDYSCGIFKFANPITHLESLTVSFGSPLEPVVFDTDRLTASVNEYAKTTQFDTNNNTDHNIVTGDVIYITGFNTMNPNGDNDIINSINSTNGNIVTVPYPYGFSINVDTSSLKPTVFGTLSATNGSSTIIGTDTSFFTTFVNGDIIVLNTTNGGVNNPIDSYYYVDYIVSDTELNLAGLYVDDTANNLTYQKNNIISDLQVSVYFGSKRIFIPLEIHYNETTGI